MIGNADQTSYRPFQDVTQDRIFQDGSSLAMTKHTDAAHHM